MRSNLFPIHFARITNLELSCTMHQTLFLLTLNVLFYSSVQENPLGIWEFRSKSRHNSCSTEGFCRGYMFALELTEELDTWPQEDNHGRRWVSIIE